MSVYSSVSKCFKIKKSHSFKSGVDLSVAVPALVQFCTQVSRCCQTHLSSAMSNTDLSDSEFEKSLESAFKEKRRPELKQSQEVSDDESPPERQKRLEQELEERKKKIENRRAKFKRIGTAQKDQKSASSTSDVVYVRGPDGKIRKLVKKAKSEDKQMGKKIEKKLSVEREHKVSTEEEEQISVQEIAKKSSMEKKESICVQAKRQIPSIEGKDQTTPKPEIQNFQPDKQDLPGQKSFKPQSSILKSITPDASSAPSMFSDSEDSDYDPFLPNSNHTIVTTATTKELLGSLVKEQEPEAANLDRGLGIAVKLAKIKQNRAQNAVSQPAYGDYEIDTFIDDDDDEEPTKKRRKKLTK